MALTGFIPVGDRKYFYKLENDEPSMEHFNCRFDWRLRKFLGFRLNEFLRENEFQNARDFHIRFSDFIKCNLSDEFEGEHWLKNPLSACTLVKTLQEDIRNAENYIKEINIEKKTVTIEVTDSQFRIHKAVLTLGDDYPKEPVGVLQLDLPPAKTLFNESTYDFGKLCSVSDFTRTFINVINSFQEFWNIVAIIDMQCIVLEPAKITYKDVFRRIRLSGSVSIGLTIDPLKPREMPSIKFFGWQSDVDHCKKILQNNLEKQLWDFDEDLLYNISNILDVIIPNKMFANEVDLFELAQGEECAICFMWRLGDELPDERCETAPCKSIYHSTCLFKYLSSIPKNRQYFGKMQGECPNCDNLISCSVPKFNLI